MFSSSWIISIFHLAAHDTPSMNNAIAHPLYVLNSLTKLPNFKVIKFSLDQQDWSICFRLSDMFCEQELSWMFSVHVVIE